MTGRFITIEGSEGAGKSTAQTFLADKLAAQGISVLQTREPGGTPLAESIRRNLLSLDEEAPVEVAELLLVFAARWIEAEDERKLEEFRKKAAEHLSEDGGGYLTYLAPTRVNLSLMEERWPDIRFRETREH